jgi:hypothetical protein
MKWEYAHLICTNQETGGKFFGSAVFLGPSGSKTFDGPNYLLHLNELGQEGWEAYAFQARDVGYMKIEYNFCLRRPINTNTSR